MRDRLIYGALLVSDTSWLFAAFGIAGATFGLQGSPLNWLAIIVLLAVSLLVSVSLQSMRLTLIIAQGFQMIWAVIVIYLTLSSQLSEGGVGINLGWPGNVAGKESGAAILGTFFAVGLWWRGARLATISSPAETLAFSFKTGVVVLGIASVLDFILPGNLRVAWVLFPFFAAGMVGLAVSRLMPAASEASQPKAWGRVFGGTIAGILVIGAALSFLNASVLSPVGSAISGLFNLLLQVVFWVVIIPFTYLLQFLIVALVQIVSWLAGDQIGRGIEGAVTEGVQQVRDNPGDASSVATALATAMQWFIVALLIIAAIYLLARAFGWSTRRRDTGLQVRESLWAEAEPGEDLSSLLVGLLPEWMRRSRSKEGPRIPQGEPGITEVFRIYFRLLNLAEIVGSPKPTSATPAEYEGTLKSLFPQVPVQLATTAFNRACYGHLPATEEEIDRLQVALNWVEDQVKKARARIRLKLG